MKGCSPQLLLCSVAAPLAPLCHLDSAGAAQGRGLGPPRSPTAPKLPGPGAALAPAVRPSCSSSAGAARRQPPSWTAVGRSRHLSVSGSPKKQQSSLPSPHPNTALNGHRIHLKFSRDLKQFKNKSDPLETREADRRRGGVVT